MKAAADVLGGALLLRMKNTLREYILLYYLSRIFTCFHSQVPQTLVKNPNLIKLETGSIVASLMEVMSSAVTRAKTVQVVPVAKWSSSVTGPCMPVSRKTWRTWWTRLRSWMQSMTRQNMTPGTSLWGGVIHSRRWQFERLS